MSKSHKQTMKRHAHKDNSERQCNCVDCGATLSKTLLRVKTGPTADTPVTNEEVEQLTSDLAQLMEAGGEDVANRIISTIYGTDAPMEDEYEVDCGLLSAVIIRALQALVKTTRASASGEAKTIETHNKTMVHMMNALMIELGEVKSERTDLQRRLAENDRPGNQQTLLEKEVLALRRERNTQQSRADKAIRVADKLREANAQLAVELRETSEKMTELADASALECRICTEKTSHPHAFVPCGHLICGPCKGSLKKKECPFCRVPYTTSQKLYPQ